MPAEVVTLQISKGKIVSMFIAIIVAVAGAWASLSGNVDANTLGREANAKAVEALSSEIRELKIVQAKAADNSYDVKTRLTRIETMLEQVIKNLESRLTKAEEKLEGIK